MRVLVCVKRVPAPGARINVSSDGRDVDANQLGFTTSPHEECAVEAAVQLVEQHGGDATTLTVGPAAAEEQLRYAISVGIDRGVLVPAEEEWDPQRTARALAATIRRLEASDGVFDIVLFGNESADAGGFQVGIRVAHALGRPMVNGAKHIALEPDGVLVERETHTGRETYALPLPALVGVKEGMNLPRYPTMRGRLASKKADVSIAEMSADPGGLTKIRLERPTESISRTVVLGTGPDAAPRVVDVLDELGLIR